MKHIIFGILLMTQWQVDKIFIDTNINLKDSLVSFAYYMEVEEKASEYEEQEIKQLENRLRPVLSRIHKDRIEREWSESLY